MNEQCSCAPAWAKSGGPERFLIAVKQKDFEAIREATVELFDLSIKALRPVSAHDQQTRDSYPVEIGLGFRRLLQTRFLGGQQTLRPLQPARETSSASRIEESRLDRAIHSMACDPWLAQQNRRAATLHPPRSQSRR
jgi:hypothetical protein